MIPAETATDEQRLELSGLLCMQELSVGPMSCELAVRMNLLLPPVKLPNMVPDVEMLQHKELGGAWQQEHTQQDTSKSIWFDDNGSVCLFTVFTD